MKIKNKRGTKKKKNTLKTFYLCSANRYRMYIIILVMYFVYLLTFHMANASIQNLQVYNVMLMCVVCTSGVTKKYNMY